MATVWAGVDVGKEHHHCVVIDEHGTQLLSRRILNDENELRQLVDDVRALGSPLWAVDLIDGGALLLITLLIGRVSRCAICRAGSCIGLRRLTEVRPRPMPAAPG